MSTAYLTPTDDIVTIVDVPLSPALSVSPCGRHLLLWDRPPLKTIADMSAKEFKVAGKRLSKYFTPSLSRSSFYTGISVARLPPISEPLARGGGLPLKATQVAALGKGMFRYHRWNQAGDLLCFCRLDTTSPNEGLRLFLLDPNKLGVHGPLAVDDARLPLSASLGTPVCWLNNRQLLCSVASRAGDPLPEPNPVPTGPDTQEHTSTKKKKVRSYQDLIKSDYDETLFRHMGTSHLVLVTIDLKKDGRLTIARKQLAPPALYCSVRASPSGQYLLLSSYSDTSRIVRYNRFGETVSLYRFDSAGQQLTFIRHVAELPVADQVPLTHNSCRPGKRFSFWSEGHGALLVSARALDGGDARVDVEHRDELLCQSEADDFATETRLVRTALRWYGMDFLEDGKTAILSESWWHTKVFRRWLCTLDGQARVT